MLYFKLDSKLEVLAIASDMPAELKTYNPEAECPWYRKGDGSYGPGGWLNRNDIDSFMLALQIAGSAIRFSKKAYIAIDRGSDTSSRFDVILAPGVGDDVSMNFNGDSYPIGKITAISATMKMITVNGARGVMKFYRKNTTGAWLSNGWALIPGIRNDFNQEF